MAWQKCPVCNGLGINLFDIGNYISFSTSNLCGVCKGAGIISEVSGLPPVQATKTLSSDTSTLAELIKNE